MSFAKKMGREQKRRNKHFKALAEYSAKKGASARRQVVHAENRQYIAELRQKAEVISYTLTLLLASVHARFGFGKKRLQKLDDKIFSHYDCIKSKLVTVSDIDKILLEEGKFDIRKKINKPDDNKAHKIEDELISCFFIALMDGFGFKSKRLSEAYLAVVNVADAVNNKELSIDDLIQELIKAKYLNKDGKKAA